MDKLRELLDVKLDALHLPLSTHRAILRCFDEARDELWEIQRQEIHKIFSETREETERS